MPRVNVLGTLGLLELARKQGVRKIVFASTGGAVYGEGYSPEGDRLPFTETSWPQPKDNYGANKLSAEHHLDLYYYAYGLEYVALRYPNVYGPRQDSKGEAGVVAIFAGAMLDGEPTKITGDGKQARDFTFVGDIAHANLLALQSDAVGVINVGTGIPTNINTIHSVLSDVIGYSQDADLRAQTRRRSARDVSGQLESCSRCWVGSRRFRLKTVCGPRSTGCVAPSRHSRLPLLVPGQAAYAPGGKRLVHRKTDDGQRAIPAPSARPFAAPAGRH